MVEQLDLSSLTVVGFRHMQMLLLLHGPTSQAPDAAVTARLLPRKTLDNLVSLPPVKRIFERSGKCLDTGIKNSKYSDRLLRLFTQIFTAVELIYPENL